MDRARDMVRWLISDAHRSAKEIATACDVEESTVSRWQNEDVVPNQKHLARLRDYLASVEAEMVLKSPWSLPVDRFKYICSRADSYAESKESALAALAGVLDELRRNNVPDTDRRLGTISLLIAPCPFKPNVDAHVFVAQASDSAPRAAVILYRRDLGPEALRAALVAEINHLTGHAEPTPVRLPPRKNLFGELGRKAK
jgi:hypothetical protein